MVNLFSNSLRSFSLAASLCGVFVWGAAAQDPPTRVARLSFVNGNVSLQPAGLDDWSLAAVNRPLTTGDNLWADASATAELHLNNAVMRLSSQTSFGFLNLDDHFAQIRFSQGEMVVRVRRLRDDDSFEVDTPNAAVTILREGEYRFNADPDNATTYLVVRKGEAEVTGGGQAFTIRAGSGAQLSGTDQLAYSVEYAPQPDGFESWSESRDGREASLASARYLSPDIIGYEDLDAYGSWRVDSSYGPVWFPSVGAGWAPYHDGNWAWIEPWGWTWVDNSPWGFAPSHYGRWAFVGGGWGWVPGPLAIGGPGVAVTSAIYAPALVAFFGGGGFGLSLSFGSAAIGWVPLGPGDVYTPAYTVSQSYFSSVNVSNTRIVNTVNITNVYNNIYVNKSVNVTNVKYVNMTVPNAVTAMPQNAFASGGSVKQVGVTIQRADLARVQSAPVSVAPPVAPVKQAVAPRAGSAPAPHPPARAVSAPVVAKKTPPPAPVPFAATQSALQQNLGHPVNAQAIRQSAPARPAAASAVRVAPPARAAAAPVQPSRAPAPAARPPQAVQPAQSTPAYRPPQPAQSTPAARPPQATPPTQPTPAYRPPQPAQPAPAPRTAQPAPKPPEAARPEARPAEPAARPAEAAPRPAQPKPAPKPPQKPKPEEEKEKEKEKKEPGR